MDTPDELTTVATFANTAEAELAKERLGLEGIAAFVVGGVTVQVMPYLGQGVVGLQVGTDDVGQARLVLGLGE